MAAWSYIGYKPETDASGGVAGRYVYWTNNVDVAVCWVDAGRRAAMTLTNTPLDGSELHRFLIRYAYDGDVLAWLSDWAITADYL